MLSSRPSVLTLNMLRYIYRFAQPMLQELELVKALPASISFDMQAYEKQYLNEILRTLRIPCRVLLFTLTSTISYKNPLLSYNFFHISLF